jgi:transmembrane sensor
MTDRISDRGPDRGTPPRLIDLSTVEAEAAQWVARLDAAPEDMHLKAEFERWKAQSQLHEDAATRLSGLWADMDELARLAPMVTPSAPTAWRRPGRPAGRRWQALRPAGFGALAAIAAMFAVVLGFDPATRDTLVERIIGAETRLYATAVGEQRTITLEDGSSVQLNTDSRLEVRYTASSRDLRLLRGEAFFDVAANPTRPFSVYGADGVARAVGTAFVVRLHGQRMDVTVTKGIVEVAALTLPPTPPALESLADRPRLAPALVAADNGEVATASIAPQGITRQKLSASDAARQFAWRQGMLAFSGDRLSSVIADVSRYTDIDIEIADPALNDLQVSGYFKVGEVEPMLEALESGFNVRVERLDAGHVRLRSQG